MTTTKLKLKWIDKHRAQYLQTVTDAFHTVKRELIQFLNDYDGHIDILIKYLANCVGTEDVMTFIGLMQGILKDAKDCKGDASARKATLICKYILFRLYWLSKFTIQWTNVTVKCKKCKRVVKTNYLYTNKVCDYCGSIIL